MSGVVFHCKSRLSIVVELSYGFANGISIFNNRPTCNHFFGAHQEGKITVFGAAACVCMQAHITRSPEASWEDLKTGVGLVTVSIFWTNPAQSGYPGSDEETRIVLRTMAHPSSPHQQSWRG